MRAQIFLVSLLALAPFAWAADQMVVVPVPKSELDLTPILPVLVPPVEVSLSASAYFPSGFERGGNLGTSSYANNGVPFLSLDREAEFQAFASGITLASKIGLGYLGMKRSAPTSYAGAPTGSTDQQLNVLMGRLGVEGGWARLLPWGFEPVTSLSLLPSWAFAGQSQFEEGVSAYGLPLEATAGFLWRARPRKAMESGAFSVGLEGQTIFGSVGGSKMNGAAVQGELRITL